MERGKTRRKNKLDIFNVPTYVINMKERPDRWKRFTQQPVINILKRMKKSVAVNGKRLDPINDSRISIRTRLNIFRNYRRSHHEIATLGAVGASLSHINIWKKFIQSGAKHCIILEDDAILTESALKTINDTISTLPARWGIWLLGSYIPNLVYESISIKPWNRVYNFTASHAYLLTRETALTLLNDAIPIESHIDHYISNIAVLKDILIVQHPDVHVEFFKKERVINSHTTTIDSNTSQHKKSGCPVCKIPDDFTQIYMSPTKKNRVGHGMKVRGLIRGSQSKRILTLKRGATRKGKA